MLKELKHVLDEAASKSPGELVKELDGIAENHSLSAEDQNTISLVKYFASLTDHQNSFTKSILGQFSAITAQIMEFQQGVIDKVVSLNEKVDLTSTVIKNQESIAKILDVMQKSLVSGQKFNKDAVMELKKEIQAVTVSNGDSNPVPVDIKGNIRFDDVKEANVKSSVRIGTKRVPSVVLLTLNSGEKKVLTIRRGEDGAYQGHTLSDALDS